MCTWTCVGHKENIWQREKQGKRSSDSLHRCAQPVHCCHSLHLLTFSIMSFTHGCFFPPSYTSLITLLCSSPFSLFSSPTFIPSKWPFSRSSCGVFLFLYLFYVPGQPAPGSYYWSVQGDGGLHEGEAEQMQSDMSRTSLRFMWWTSQSALHKNTQT